METITVDVSAHLTFDQFRSLPDDLRGVYLVYRINQEDSRLRLIYVGKSADVSDRVSESHQHYNDWVSWANDDPTRLRFSWGKLIDHTTDILRCEAALIYAFKPPVNQNGKDVFSYEDTEVVFTGRQVCCRGSVIAKKTA